MEVEYKDQNGRSKHKNIGRSKCDSSGPLFNQSSSTTQRRLDHKQNHAENN